MSRITRFQRRYLCFLSTTILLLKLEFYESFTFLVATRTALCDTAFYLVASPNDNGVDPKHPYDYDLAVIGGGVVGVSAALSSTSRTILIDAPTASGALMVKNKDLSLGGPTGLFSKALRDTSKRIQVSTLRGMGLREDSVWNEILSSCVDLAASNAEDIERQLKMAQVHYRQGHASFQNEHELQVIDSEGQKQIVSAQNILIATGSRPFKPEGIPFDGKRIFDSDTINTLSFLPRSIAITGSGIIAVEFAKIFRNLGADVTLIIRDNVPRNALMKIGLDQDVAATLVADLVRSGIHIVRGAQVASFDVPKDNDRAPIRISLVDAKGGGKLPGGRTDEIKCDAYLAAVGRQPNTKTLHLEKAGIDIDEYGGILVDNCMRTTSPSGTVFAAGDVLGRPFLASTGVAQGVAAVSILENEVAVQDSSKSIVQLGCAFDPGSLSNNPFAFPTGIWSSPEAAYYGYSLQQAREQGYNAGEGMALYAECLRGRVFSPNGLLKLVYDKGTGKIIGVHICGDDACELIHYGMELVKGERTILDVQSSLFSAVTFHELYRIAASAALDEAGARKRRAEAGKALAKRNRIIRDAENA